MQNTDLLQRWSLRQVSQQTETLQTQFVDWNCSNLKLASCFQTSCFVVVFFPTGTVCHEELVCQASVALKCFVLCQRFSSLASVWRNCRETVKEFHKQKTVRYWVDLQIRTLKNCTSLCTLANRVPNWKTMFLKTICVCQFQVDVLSFLQTWYHWTFLVTAKEETLKQGHN